MMLKTRLDILARIMKERPFYLWKYIFQTIFTSLNYMLLRWQGWRQPNFNIGINPRVLSFNAFKAEMPNAQITVGDWVIIYYKCDILVTGRGKFEIGNHCIIGSNFRLYCKERIVLGDLVLISWNVSISDYDGHPIDPDCRYVEMLYMQRSFFPSFGRRDRPELPEDYQPSYVTKPIIIEDNVWIGANVTILKGVHIGAGSIVAAGAVVTRNVPARCIVAGNPARVVKKLK